MFKARAFCIDTLFEHFNQKESFQESQRGVSYIVGHGEGALYKKYTDFFQ